MILDSMLSHSSVFLFVLSALLLLLLGAVRMLQMCLRQGRNWLARHGKAVAAR